MNPDGSDRTRLTDRSGPNYDGGGDYDPDWSDPSGYIHIMGADGSGQSRIAFSPRSYLAFSGWDDDGLCKTEYEGGEVDEGTPGCQDGDSEIFVSSADGSDRIQVTDNGYLISEGHPAWSPDGSKIAFGSYGEGSGIYVMGADGSDPTLIAAPGFDPD
ncbi:MAG: tolB protein precursor, periplasmic protein involved in the tonb-independent uptake of group A colicins [uncultured Rubrobacteraceae bacterium]|uniref:TolB protein, periplasmic protein involved in the tonb-independent uptake of group A colicins n=1 Tax=uncultured Rubrobacteraceae bacterium TaxID=349277 RepID=A0A6J4QEI1_9ACTN|nr:MAG: tolB protein precursor, periplasmic protein involved in the tonb-independent uptake of group A colicins [uncultured Rubrobacteraceae bacterium]